LLFLCSRLESCFVVLSSQVGLAPVAGFFFLPIFLPKTFPRDNDCGMRSEILPPDFGCQVFFPHRIRGCISRLHLRLVPPRRVFFWVQNKARRGILVSLPFGFLVRPFAWQCCLLGEDGKADSFLAISFPSLHFGAPFTGRGEKRLFVASTVCVHRAMPEFFLFP
jgi:hypothetical protein